MVKEEIDNEDDMLTEKGIEQGIEEVVAMEID